MTQEQVKLWHDYDDYYDDNELIKWYDGYQKRKIQKAQIKKELMPIAWHPSRWWDWCVPEDEKKEIEILWKFVEIWSERGYNQRVLWTKTNN